MKPEKEKIDDKYMFIYKKGIEAGKASRDGIFTVGDIMAIEKRAKQEAISNFAEKIKERTKNLNIRTDRTHIIEMHICDFNNLIDKLAKEQTSGELSKSSIKPEDAQKVGLTNSCAPIQDKSENKNEN